MAGKWLMFQCMAGSHTRDVGRWHVRVIARFQVMRESGGSAGDIRPT